MNGPCRAHHVVSTGKIFSSATFFIFVQIGNVNSNRNVAAPDRSFVRFEAKETSLRKILFDEVINTPRYSNIPWNNSLENLLYVHVN